MENLNFPGYHFRFKNSENNPLIFDVVRKKFVALQPEEWVRQHVVRYLHETKNYPLSLINVEKQIRVHTLSKRFDIVVYSPNGEIEILVECKAPKVKITEDSFDQAARYNLDLRARFLLVTNGLDHYFCRIDYKNSSYIFIEDFPSYTGRTA
ncbi:type I restriction enzyme HsdR N-terminal domain-containing protein [Muriicola marianensis]|uniref:Restriction endonuclease subunit R n=1 Tax=Muriicola marianensis TaxID=1324801 RepID=A0ABQ1QQU0_9FLAO|nr:type I restriction enzyme HsdR N-terminal domain-containing protein [Muriicola marianensis]GGD39650.1 restriction endonuclease subunit R [Muriicola marianensis]